jgi:endonuclease IV
MYENSTVVELKIICKKKGIRGYSGLKKAGIIKIIKDDEKKQAPKNNIPKNNSLKIGIHVFKGKNMAESIKTAKQLCPLNSVQIFSHGPRSMNKVGLNVNDIIANTGDVNLYVHSSYPTNPWNGKELIMKHTLDQLATASSIKAVGVILHIPLLPPHLVVETVVVLVRRMLDIGINDQRVILEMKAVKQHPTNSYESPEKINRLITLLKDAGLTPEHVGICIDTAHIYAGKAEIHTYKQGVDYLNTIEDPEWVALIHLNGNVYDAKKRAGDKHAVPFDHEDKVWKDITYRNSGCRAFIEWAQAHNVNFILEVKDHHTFDQVNGFVRLAKSVLI